MTTTSITECPVSCRRCRVYEWDPPEVTGEPWASRYFVGTSRAITQHALHGA